MVSSDVSALNKNSSYGKDFHSGDLRDNVTATK